MPISIMADGIMMLDQAMDIDSNVSTILPTTDGAPAATTTNQTPLHAHRNISNPKENRARLHEPLKVHTIARIQKSYAPASKTASHQAYTTNAPERIKRRGLRKEQVLRAITDGSFRAIQDTDVVSPRGGDTSNPGDNPIFAPPQDQREVVRQLRRLDADLVAAALFEPIPGMLFDPTAPCAFTSDPALMADLVQALEAFQMHLARKGMVVLSSKAGNLLRGLSRDVLYMILKRRDLITPRCMVGAGVDDFWAGVARDYVTCKKLKWLAGRYLSADPCRKLMAGRTESLCDFLTMLLEAVECPGKHSDLIEALGPVGDGMPSFIVAQPSTLQALMGHFETARARYLANLKKAHGKSPPNNNAFHQAGAAGFGKLPRGGDRQYDSSEDEDEGPRGGMRDGGAEDDGQVAEGVSSEPGQWFLVNLDRFTASKGGQQQGGVDANMISALDLGGAKSNR